MSHCPTNFKFFSASRFCKFCSIDRCVVFYLRDLTRPADARHGEPRRCGQLNAAEIFVVAVIDLILKLADNGHRRRNTTDKLAGRELTFSGIVTKAEHRIAKSGKAFGSLSLEDHHGTFDLMLFSEDYLKFKLYLQTGALLLVKGRASARTWGRDEGQMEFKISSIDLLSDAREKYITKLNLTPLGPVRMLAIRTPDGAWLEFIEALA